MKKLAHNYPFREKYEIHLYFKPVLCHFQKVFRVIKAMSDNINKFKMFFWNNNLPSYLPSFLDNIFSWIIVHT